MRLCLAFEIKTSYPPHQFLHTRIKRDSSRHSRHIGNGSWKFQSKETCKIESVLFWKGSVHMLLPKNFDSISYSMLWQVATFFLQGTCCYCLVFYLSNLWKVQSWMLIWVAGDNKVTLEHKCYSDFWMDTLLACQPQNFACKGEHFK